MNRKGLHYFIGADEEVLKEHNSWRYAMIVEPDQKKLNALDKPPWPLRNHRLQAATTVDGLNHNPLSVLLTMALENSNVHGPVSSWAIGEYDGERKEILEAQLAALSQMAARLRFNKMVAQNFKATCARGCRVLEPTPLEHCPPIIVVGAGPSLAKNIDVLRDIQHRALIFAADTVVDYLRENDVRPSLAGTLDPQPLAEQKLKRKMYTDFPVVYTPGALPKNVKRFQSPSLYIPRNNLCFDVAKALGTPCTSTMAIGNVVALLVDVALRLGANPLILVGCDLAVEAEETHAPGVRFRQRGHTLINRMYKRETRGWGGGTVKTSDVFLAAIRALAVRFREGDWTDQSIFNCTEGGAAIPGTTSTPLAEVGEVLEAMGDHHWADTSPVDPPWVSLILNRAREFGPLKDLSFLDKHVLLPVEIERQARLEFNHVSGFAGSPLTKGGASAFLKVLGTGDLALQEEHVRQTLGAVPLEEYWTEMFMAAAQNRQELLTGEG